MPTIQQRAQAAFNALIQNITATVVAGSYARVAAIPLLSHYTSVEAFASIRRSGQFWFSNIPDMAAIDTSEVIEGTQIVSDALRTVGPQVIRTIPHAQMNAGFLFEQMKTPVLTETYAISLCEHGSDQQTDRLTMWHVYGHKGHSLVFETGESIPAEALFLEYQEASGEILTPELFPRADGTTWVCAVSGTGPLPVDPAEVAADDGAHSRLEAMCRNISPALAAATIVARQACFRPVTEDGLPLIGAVPGMDGAYVATGHSVWGMLNAPATGEAMAELILDGQARQVDLAPFAPGRLRTFDAAKLQGVRLRGR